MTGHRKETFLCPVCQEQKQSGEIMHRELVPGPIGEAIRKSHPDWSSHDLICLSCLNHLRASYVQEVLETAKGKLSGLELRVVKSLKEYEILSKNIHVEFDRHLTIGERIADKVAEFGGSWRFIITFTGILVVWVALNTVVLLKRPFDPFPFIFLNLVLSGLAAIQARIIMMSQNRSEAKDRMLGEHDYLVNLKAELEIRHLQEKIDHLLTHQWQSLLEIQQVQIELMEEFVSKTPRKPPSYDPSLSRWEGDGGAGSQNLTEAHRLQNPLKKEIL